MIKARIARETDFQDIAQVYIETWRDSYAGTLPDRVLIDMKKEKLVVSFSQTLQHHSEVLVVAEDTKEGIVGMGSAGRNRDRRSKYLGEVYTLYVHPSHQNKGIGKMLLSHLFCELTKFNINSSMIWVLAGNPSRFFYEVMGGKMTGVRDETLWGTALKEICYGWINLSKTIGNQTWQLHQRRDD